MNKREHVIAKINAFDFHDGEIGTIQHDGEIVIMSFKNWQTDLYQISFKGVVGFQAFEFPSTPEAMVKTESPFIAKCIESIELATGAPEGYSEYQFIQLDIECDGYPMSIVFQDIEIEKESDTLHRAT